MARRRCRTRRSPAAWRSGPAWVRKSGPARGTGFGATRRGAGGVYGGAAVGVGLIVAVGTTGAGAAVGAACTTPGTEGFCLRAALSRASRSAGTFAAAASDGSGSAPGALATDPCSLCFAAGLAAGEPPLSSAWTRTSGRTRARPGAGRSGGSGRRASHGPGAARHQAAVDARGALPRRVRMRVYLPILRVWVTRISIVARGR